MGRRRRRNWGRRGGHGKREGSQAYDRSEVESRPSARLLADFPSLMLVDYTLLVVRLEVWVLATAAWLLGACSADSRREPSPGQMCRELAEECSDLGRSRLDQCAQIGERGLSDSTREDQCFVYYDSCISECRFVVEPRDPDAGTVGGEEDAAAEDSDAGATPTEDAGSRDAG